MKKTILIILAATASIALTSCGSCGCGPSSDAMRDVSTSSSKSF